VANVVGSALGFLVSGLLLSIWIDLGAAPDGLDEDSPQWIGAWWLCFAFVGIPTLVLGVAGMVFPKSLPGTEAVRTALAQSAESTNSGLEAVQTTFRAGLCAVLKNPTAVHNTIASAFEGMVRRSLCACRLAPCTARRRCR
jgi:hypothetical protein